MDSHCRLMTKEKKTQPRRMEEQMKNQSENAERNRREEPFSRANDSAERVVMIGNRIPARFSPFIMCFRVTC